MEASVIPQMILIILWSISLGLAMSQHGKPKEGRNNCFITMCSFSIELGLLYCGGFFACFSR
jgi:hypothetical protein